MKNYTKTNVGNEGRVELHEKTCAHGRGDQRKQTPRRRVCAVCSFSQEHLYKRGRPKTPDEFFGQPQYFAITKISRRGTLF